MSELHVRQIRAHLDKVFQQLIDVSDLTSRSSQERTNGFLSRSLAALSLTYLSSIRPDEASKAITDGFRDNGLDAVFYHPAERLLYLVQAKWHNDGNGTIDRGDMQKFLKGFRDLLSARWDRFNQKIASRSKELDAVLEDPSTRICLLITFTGQQKLSSDVSQDLQDVVSEINDTSELVTTQVLRQGDVYSVVAQGIAGAPIDIDLALYDWGQTREPYVGYYGQVSASDVASWFSNHQSRLLTENIRMFLGQTEVNEAIVDTLLKAPQDFWYFNNGITALCRTIQKKPIGGNTKETGFFQCHDLRIVNGAQTVGAIAQAAAKKPDQVAKARVTIRVISLENCPPDFDKQVTRYTNTQNRIDRRDFVALDIEQERIRGELQLEGISYTYKSGEPQLPGPATFGLEEATVAQACAQKRITLSVQAKREIGKLWEDITTDPYKSLFNPSVSGPVLWRKVQIVRKIEEALSTARSASDGRRRLLAFHGNRYITHIVMTTLSDDYLSSALQLTEQEGNTVFALTLHIYDQTHDLLEKHYQDAYLASLFKNASKCQDLKKKWQSTQKNAA